LSWRGRRQRLFLSTAGVLSAVALTGCTAPPGNAPQPVPFEDVGPTVTGHPWMSIHGDPGNRDFMPMLTPWQFAYRETILPMHRNVSGMAIHANGDVYFITATMPPADGLMRILYADEPEQAFLSRYSPAERRVIAQLPLSVEACLAAPLLAPDGSIYTIEADRVARWSEDLELLGEVPLPDPPDLDRDSLLIPYRFDGAASMNYDPQRRLIHAVTLCGRWVVIDEQSGQLARPVESLGLFVTNTPAVDAQTGTVYVVGVPQAAALEGYDDRPAPRSSLFVRVPLPLESKAEVLSRDDLQFVDLLVLGLFGDLFNASSGELLALIPQGADYLRRSVAIAGSSETSPTLGYDGTIYLSDGEGHFLAFDPDLNEKWRFLLPGGESFGSPAVDPSGAIYLAAGRPRGIGVFKLRDYGDHVEQEWFFGGSRLYRGLSVEQHLVRLVSSIFVPTASGAGFCLGYEATFLDSLLEETGLPRPLRDALLDPPARVFAIELRTGRVLYRLPFETFSFTGAMPVGDVLLAPSFDLFDERFGLLARPAGFRVYEASQPANQ
jgi:hypothetical protein